MRGVWVMDQARLIQLHLLFLHAIETVSYNSGWHAHTYTHKYKYTHAHTRTHAHMHAHTRIHTCTCTRAHTHTHTHTHTITPFALACHTHTAKRCQQTGDSALEISPLIVSQGRPPHRWGLQRHTLLCARGVYRPQVRACAQGNPDCACACVRVCVCVCVYATC